MFYALINMLMASGSDYTISGILDNKTIKNYSILHLLLK
jgi:hypothetical protein